jgi:hypothetical protein
MIWVLVVSLRRGVFNAITFHGYCCHHRRQSQPASPVLSQNSAERFFPTGRLGHELRQGTLCSSSPRVERSFVFVAALRGQPVADIVQCGLIGPKLLTEQHLHHKNKESLQLPDSIGLTRLAPQAGLEPATLRLTA